MEKLSKIDIKTTHDFKYSKPNKYFNLDNIKRNKTLIFGILITLVFLLIFLFAEKIAMHDPYKMNILETFKPPFFMKGGTTQHLFGTDELGRDLFSRIIFGIRLSFIISFFTVIAIVLIGSSIGIIAGYYGGIVDTILMRLTDIQLSLPIIILAVAILSVWNPTPFTLTVVLTIGLWPGYARVVRSSTLSEKQKDYVNSAKVTGICNKDIILHYILPNILPSILIVSILDLAGVIVWEAVLGFIGLSVLPPTPTLGNIMGDGKNYMIMAWWISTMPGFVMFCFLSGLMSIANGLKKYFNIESQRSIELEG